VNLPDNYDMTIVCHIYITGYNISKSSLRSLSMQHDSLIHNVVNLGREISVLLIPFKIELSKKFD
jgi:hypothetical protein